MTEDRNPMCTLARPMTSPNSLKRTFADAGLEDTITHHDSNGIDHMQASSSLAPIETHASPNAPPAPSAILEPFSSAPSTHSTAPLQEPTVPASDRSSKKPKLSFAEREIKRIEKEFRDRQRAEDKAKKEEEKANRDAEKAKREEEKRIRDAEKDAEREEKRKAREQQNRVKEEEKQRKEGLKQRKEDEMNKKARSQLRLNSFFVQPSMPSSSSNTSPTRDVQSPLSSRRSSITDIKTVGSESRSRSVSVTAPKAQLPDYTRYFPSFFLQSHTTLAPYNRFSRDEQGLSHAKDEIDEAISQHREVSKLDTALGKSGLLRTSSGKIGWHARSAISVKGIIERIHGSSQHPIDLTSSRPHKSVPKPTEMLKSVPIKYLKFAEDVRPPYIGTCTKLVDRHIALSLSKKPFSRIYPKTNYDYDSEAEWEDPGEGEDLDSEGEEELEDEEEEAEMEGFLDDEEAHDASRTVKRRPILGDLEPTSTGLCWEGDPCSAEADMRCYKLDILMENPSFPIDPYSTAYWQPTPTTKLISSSPNGRQKNLMEPPRVPLNPINRANHLLSPSSSENTKIGVVSDNSSIMKAPKAPKRLIAPELMEAFKNTIDGSDLTKVGLIEILKKRFPRQPKNAIKDTLEIVAERVGGKMTEMRWVLKRGAQQ